MGSNLYHKKTKCKIVKSKNDVNLKFSRFTEKVATAEKRLYIEAWSEITMLAPKSYLMKTP